MTGYRTNFARLAASAAVATVMLSGCAMGGGNDRPSSYAAKPLAGKTGKTVAKAEQVVAANPRDAGSRAALGGAYLEAGRFASAAAAYNDALDLGDERPGTVLALALAETANGNAPAALELLGEWKDVIPASELGLAYALAGETTRGVETINSALRAGDASPKTRQNLAFALALDGQWREARVMVMQDVPADQVDARISEWAMMGRPDQVAVRVAHLVGTVPAQDPGQPQALALANFPGTQDLVREAAAQVAPAPAVAAPVVTQAPAPVRQAQAELPALTLPAAPPPMVAAAAAPVSTIVPMVQPIKVASLDRVPMGVVRQSTAMTSVALPAAKPRVASRFVSDAKPAFVPGRKTVASAPKVAANGGSHWVQLGSYTDPAVAKDGWRKFVSRTPGLKPYPAVTTTATVNGAQVWRVAASGFGSYADAERMCRSVKAKGGACLVKRAESAPVRSGNALASLRR